MDCELDARGCRGSGYRLCGAAGCLCAGLPSPTGLRSAAGARPTFHNCHGGGHAICPDSRLVGSAGSPSSGGSPGATADSRRGPCGPTSASSRGRPGRSCSPVCLDIGLLGLERPLGMGWWPMDPSAKAHGRLGGRPLVATRPRLCVDRRRLALVLKRSQPSPSASLAPTGPHAILNSVSRRHAGALAVTKCWG
jgi:hypothetical protein